MAYTSSRWSISLSLLRPIFYPRVVYINYPLVVHTRPALYVSTPVIYTRPTVVQTRYVYESRPDPVVVPVYDAISELTVQLKYGDVEERRRAARELGERLSLRALYPLLYALEYDEDALVRLYAARSLGRLGSDEALAPLERAMYDDPEEIVRITAAEAIEYLLST